MTARFRKGSAFVSWWTTLAATTPSWMYAVLTPMEPAVGVVAAYMTSSRLPTTELVRGQKTKVMVTSGCFSGLLLSLTRNHQLVEGEGHAHLANPPLGSKQAMEATAAASTPPERLKLLCYVVGVEEGDIFPVDITDELTVGDLKDEIKAKNQNTIPCDADQLRLFLATTADRKDWLHVRSEDVKTMMNGEIPPAIQAMMHDNKKLFGGLTIADVLGGAKPVPSHLHVLVSLGGSHRGPKRMRSVDVFKADIKRIKLNPKVVDANGQPRETKYFDIGDFPPMVHAATDFTRIMEHDAYRVIFDGMLAHVSKCLSKKSKGNVIVTGNPGIGKSRFYLYCAFHLVTRQLDIVKKLPPYRLLLNCKDEYYIYDPTSKRFKELLPGETKALSSASDVLRLIDGVSDRFYPWLGINVLFGSSGVTDTKDLEKDKCRQFVMPVWTLEEIEECNALLKMDENLRKLALSDSDLKERYRVFGGVARWVFSDDVDADRFVQTRCGA